MTFLQRRRNGFLLCWHELQCVLLQRVDLHCNNDGYERKGE